jgi:hypothetical protein
MQFIEVKISKSDLDKIPEAERVFFIKATNFLNDLNIARKLLFSVSNRKVEGIQEKARNSQALFFIKIIAGLLAEGWEMLQKDFFAKKISYENKLTNDGSKSLKCIKNYFGKRKNLIKLIRNEFSFHYSVDSSERIKEVVNDVGESESFEIYLSMNDQGNCLYYMASIFTNGALLKSTHEADAQKANNRILSEVKLISSHFQLFLGECIAIIIKRYLNNYSKIKEPEHTPINKVFLPYFLKK